MAEETKATNPEAPCATENIVVSDVPVAEKPTSTIVEKEAPPQAETEPASVEKPAAEEVAEGEKEKEEASDENKIAESASFKEESNKVDDLIDPEKKALEEFKQLIQEALNKHEFTAPSPPPLAPAKEEEKKVEQPKVEEKKQEEAMPEEKKEEEEPKTEEKEEEEAKTEEKTETCETPAEVPPPPPAAEPVKEEVVEKKVEEKETPPPAAEPSETVVVEKVEEKVEATEEIKETIVHEVTAPAPPPCEEPAASPAEEEKPKEEGGAASPPPPEEVSIWGVPLLADERSDVILLKFLRARDFKVKEAFAMLKSVVAWRKEFKIDELLEEEGIGEGLEKVVYIHGVDKEGHPVCYNAFGEFQDKELYSNTFSDAEKRAKFLRWYIQFLEKNIRKLDFTPEGTCTIVQVTDLKNSPGLLLFKKELRQATNQALQLLQDNYPEFVAKQVFINVPWWYVAYNRMISPFLTQRTKSKFVFAGPTRTAETLFKYIAPEQVPVQYGGLSKVGEEEFTTANVATEEIIKPTCKHTIELPITEAGTLVWEVRVVGWDVSYGAEFVPSAEGGYTWIVQKTRKIGPADEQAICCTFKIGEPGKVVLTFENQTSKKKKLLYRSKTKASE
ncbi:Phosphatidylinositol transfer protein SEC14 [Handroanthus impetiginosus]|uniref:Phosphatidylinositol transfer protein SEC14 n=1 Tax=Handroanthus impetiginosus TaxID=429701 RepID=A0A2G9H5B6_9LAMI|nr:Phosphatidylinositol transfer protein SEC14 [Handroanthus impetiginosus]